MAAIPGRGQVLAPTGPWLSSFLFTLSRQKIGWIPGKNGRWMSVIKSDMSKWRKITADTRTATGSLVADSAAEALTEAATARSVPVSLVVPRSQHLPPHSATCSVFCYLLWTNLVKVTGTWLTCTFDPQECCCAVQQPRNLRIGKLLVLLVEQLKKCIDLVGIGKLATVSFSNDKQLCLISV